MRLPLRHLVSNKENSALPHIGEWRGGSAVARWWLGTGSCVSELGKRAHMPASRRPVAAFSRLVVFRTSTIGMTISLVSFSITSRQHQTDSIPLPGRHLPMPATPPCPSPVTRPRTSTPHRRPSDPLPPTRRTLPPPSSAPGSFVERVRTMWLPRSPARPSAQAIHQPTEPRTDTDPDLRDHDCRRGTRGAGRVVTAPLLRNFTLQDRGLDAMAEMECPSSMPGAAAGPPPRHAPLPGDPKTKGDRHGSGRGGARMTRGGTTGC